MALIFLNGHSATRHEEAETHQDPGNNKKKRKPRLAVEDLIGFPSHIESHVSISLVNLSNYSVNSLYVDVTQDVV